MVIFLTRYHASCVVLLLSSMSIVSAVRIGAVVNPHTRVGKEQRIAIEMAVEEFNSSSTPLFLNLQNSTMPAAVPNITLVEDLLQSWRADVVLIGMGTWSDATILANLTNVEQVPIITFSTVAATSASTPHLPSSPWLISIPGAFSTQIRCVAELIGSYSWRRVFLLYEESDEPYVNGDISLLSKELRAVGSDIQGTMPLKPYDSFEDPKKSIREGLNELNEDICRVFVVFIFNASRDFRNELFQEATSLGMMEKGYVWLVVDSSSSSSSHSSSTSTMQGVVEIRNQVNENDTDSYSYQKILDKFKQRFRNKQSVEEEEEEEEEENTVGGPYALRVYDAVRAVAMAQNSTGTSPIITGSFLGEQIRSKLSRSHSINNIVGKAYREMGFWSEGVGFHNNTHNKQGQLNASEAFGSVYWPGGPNWVPGGWDVLDVIVPSETTFEEFVDVEVEKDGTLKRVTGFSIDVFKMVLQEMPYRLRVKYHPYNGTYDCMVTMLHNHPENVNDMDTCIKGIQDSNKKYHAAIGDITILGYRSEIVDFTVPYVESGLSKVVQVRQGQKASVFLQPFTWKLWLGIIVVVLYTGIIISFLERDKDNNNRRPNLKDVGNSVWFTYLTFYFAQGRLQSNFAKVAILVWLFTCLVLTQSYTASLSSILTVQKLQPATLRGHERVGCDGDSFVLDYLQNILRYKKQDIEKIDSQDKYPPAFRKGNITSAYLEVPYLRVFLSKYGDDFIVTGETHKFAGLGFAFRKGSPLTADVSTTILNMIDAGKLKELTEKTFTVDLFSCQQGGSSKNKDNLDIDSFWFLFLLSGGTSTAVLAFFFIKLFIKFREDHKRQARIQPREENLQRQQPHNRELDIVVHHFNGCDDRVEGIHEMNVRPQLLMRSNTIAIT